MRHAVAGLCLLAACGGSGAGASPAGSGGLATSIDSTADTVFARVPGVVPTGAIRRLVEEMRIAPAADDTTLFTEVFEFDVDRAGRLWVYDRPTNSIFLFDAAGKLLRHVGRQGSGPGEFKSDNGMVTLADSGLAISDATNARISFFSAAGDFRTSWRTPTGFYTSDGLLTDRTGTLFLKRAVTPPREGEILGRMGLVRLKPDGIFGDSLAPPDLPVQREVYVATSKDGGSHSAMGTSLAPNYFWAWHPDGYFVAAHGGNYEIVVTRPGYRPLAIRREVAPTPVLAAERDEEHARIIASMQQTDPSWTWTGPAVPESKAPLQGLFVARDGTIWARVAVASEQIPEAELVKPRNEKMPVIHFRMPLVYEVFGSDGHFLGRVAFPPRSRLMEADGNSVWALLRDENDLPAVVRLRIDPALREPRSP